MSAHARRASPGARAAAFLFAGIITVAALVLFALRPTLFSGARHYVTTFRNVAGLNVGDEVRYGGLRVGVVTELELDTGDITRVLVRFRVRPATPVRDDTRAQIAQLGLFGQPYLALDPGRSDAPPLAEGGMLPGTENLTPTEAMRRLTTTFDRADSLFASLERLTRDAPLERLDTTLLRADRLLQTATSGSERVIGRLDVAGQRLAALLARSERLISEMDTALASARPELASTQREAVATLRELRDLVGEVRVAMEQGGGLDDLVRNMTAAAENFARLSARLERDPTSVLRQRAPVRKTAGPAPRDE